MSPPAPLLPGGSGTPRSRVLGGVRDRLSGRVPGGAAGSGRGGALGGAVGRRLSSPLGLALASAVLGAVLASALAGGAYTGRPLLVAALLPVQGLLALSWLAYVGAPAQLRGAALATGAGLVADVLEARRGTEVVGALAGVVALSVLVAVTLQLSRRNRASVTESLAGHVSAVLLCVSPALLVALRGGRGGRDAAVAALLALAAGGLAGRVLGVLLPRPGLATERGLAGLVGWVAAGAGAGAAVLGRDGLLLGAATAAAAAFADLATGGVTDRGRALLLGAALPLATGAPAGYVLGRVLFG